jgi:transcriptional regulator with XRE-family HTH domain
VTDSASPKRRYQVTQKFIDAVRAERQLGWTQKAIATKAQVPPVVLTRWIRRYWQDPPTPDDPQLHRLAMVLRLPLYECIEEVKD